MDQIPSNQQQDRAENADSVLVGSDRDVDLDDATVDRQNSKPGAIAVDAGDQIMKQTPMHLQSLSVKNLASMQQTLPLAYS